MTHKDPYKIWLFEIIMQQTRINQGTPYYERFIAKYPNVKSLANASIDEVLKLWEGLGYYSRARNLHHAANQICEEYGGVFPSSSKALEKLKGVGKYTSAAIATFAYDEQIGVVDGNVYRVLSRVFGIEDPIDQGVGQKKFYALAQELVDKRKPAVYNQAIMDFGAMQCTPKIRSCKDCTMINACHAFAHNTIDALPVKSKKLVKTTRYFTYLVIVYNQGVILRQRVKKDIWKLLYEYPYIETPDKNKLTKTKLRKYLKEEFGYSDSFIWTNEQKKYKQQLTHQTIIGSFHNIEISCKPNLVKPYLLVKQRSISRYAFPKIIDCYLNDNSISLFK